MLNLDTNMVILAFGGGLRSVEERLLTTKLWSISAIVYWELAKLAQLGRIELDLGDREVVRRLNSMRVWPIDLAVALASTRLDFRSDPADEIIAATSVVHDVPLLTRDKVMNRSKVVPLAI